jgi:hypothetical protein
MTMFLFTTPSARDSAPATPVVDAIRQGAERTGTGFDYLLATAQRESALDPGARARSSSASGLFQFIEQTWLGLVKSDGPRLGLGDYANAISARSDGTYAVSDPAAKQAILNLRDDPKTASVLAGAFTQRNRDTLAADIGREPSPSDLYIAHFLGARGAAQLIQAAQQSPTRPAASDFPDAAAANRTIFFDRSGRARGAGEVYALLTANHAGAAPATAAPAFAPDRPVAFAQSDGPAFHGLFQTETRRGPISEAVAKLWRGGEGGTEAKATAVAFFPKSDLSQAVEPEPVQAADSEPLALADVPLPPRRPSDLDAAPVERARAGRSSRGGPLELRTFMKRRGA